MRSIRSFSFIAAVAVAILAACSNSDPFAPNPADDFSTAALCSGGIYGGTSTRACDDSTEGQTSVTNVPLPTAAICGVVGGTSARECPDTTDGQARGPGNSTLGVGCGVVGGSNTLVCDDSTGGGEASRVIGGTIPTAALCSGGIYGGTSTRACDDSTDGQSD